MRRKLLILALIGFVLAGCSRSNRRATTTPPPASPGPAVSATPTGTPAPTVVPTSTPGQADTTAWDDLQAYESALLPAAIEGLELKGLPQYKLDVTLSPDMAVLAGLERVRYTNRETVTLDSLHLHLFPNLWDGGMQIASVLVDGVLVAPSLTSNDALLEVPLDRPLEAGDSVTLAIEFTIPIPTDEGVGNYGEFGYDEGILALAHFYPTLVVYDTGAGWHLETPSSQGDVIYADASLFDVNFIAPSHYVVVASGETLGYVDNQDGTRTWRLAGGPMRDFNIVASPDYQSVTTTVGDVKVNSYYLTRDKAAASEALRWSADAMSTYQEAFGAYPYRELDIVPTGTSAGGIEYPGMVVLALNLYRDSDRAAFFEGATAHEVAHQWWYDVVGNDQVNAPWLDEALAQYSTYLYYRSVHGEEGAAEFRKSLDERWARVDNEDKPIGLPVEEYTEKEYGAIVYGRGPLFLIALEDQIGVDKMSALLGEYYQKYAWKIATPADFQTLAESVSGQDLSALFDEWVYPKK